MTVPTYLIDLHQLAREHQVTLWLVGGYVRDRLLGHEPPDVDLALSGAARLARRVARAWGGALVPLDEERETARVVLKRGPDQAPLWLDFAELQGSTIEEDLARRDFTLNAMAWELADFIHGQRALIDPFHGLADLNAGLIRAVSRRSLDEDPLRTVRAFRFAAQLGFELEPETQAWVREAAPQLACVAVERITAELFKMLAAPLGYRWLLGMVRAGVWGAIFREAAVPAPRWERAVEALRSLEERLEDLTSAFPDSAVPLAAYLALPFRLPLLKLATLLYGTIPRERQDQLGQRLKLSREQQRLLRTFGGESRAPRAALLRALRSGNPAALSPRVRGLLVRHFRRTAEDGVGAVLVQGAHLGQERGNGSLQVAVAAALRLYYQEVAPILHRPRLLTGDDLIQALQLTPGPLFKKLLAAVLQAELMGEVTTREEALALAQRLGTRGQGDEAGREGERKDERGKREPHGECPLD